MEGQLALSELFVISWVFAFQGCPLNGPGSTACKKFANKTISAIKNINMFMGYIAELLSDKIFLK